MHHLLFFAKRRILPSSSNNPISTKFDASRGFSLIEVLLVVAIIGLAILAGFLVYSRQINRAHDGKRKSELHGLRTILEDFYNDHRCYPRPTEICYDAETNSDNPCHICGSEDSPVDGEKISVYNLPCNPNHPEERYLYETEDSACPSWYRVFTKLFDTDNTGPCPYSLCGPDNGSGGYDYAVTSPNVGVSIPTQLRSYDSGTGQCVICGDLEGCVSTYNEPFYASLEACCMDNLDRLGEHSNCRFTGHFDGECTTCQGTLRHCSDQGSIYSGPNWLLDKCCVHHPGAGGCPY